MKIEIINKDFYATFFCILFLNRTLLMECIQYIVGYQNQRYKSSWRHSGHILHYMVINQSIGFSPNALTRPRKGPARSIHSSTEEQHCGFSQTVTHPSTNMANCCFRRHLKQLEDSWMKLKDEERRGDRECRDALKALEESKKVMLEGVRLRRSTGSG